MVDLHGRAYVMEHCAEFFLADVEEKRYRAYVTDALKLITENTAKGVQGRYLTTRWAELITKRRAAQQDQSGDEIALEFIRRAGLSMGGQ